MWREDAYVRIYDSGVRGKLWRQLQAMHKGITRRVMHPLGMTDWFEVERGVAQGAVESPWVYANFIDGLAQELKARGLGICIGGQRIPLLMYADDIVAATQQELMLMNRIASRFAQRHRFQFNGEKSGIMLFNTKAKQRATARHAPCRLFGEKVRVTNSYIYLGTVTPADGMSWTATIAKARRRSADLLWMCRSDRGIRPRTAITLWQSMVRPILEYASEIWAGQVPEALCREAESVQCTFLRGTLGLHANGSGVTDDALRAEVGCEPLEDRSKAQAWLLAPPLCRQTGQTIKKGSCVQAPGVRSIRGDWPREKGLDGHSSQGFTVGRSRIVLGGTEGSSQ